MFRRHMDAFAHTLEGLRSFVDMVQPVLDNKNQEMSTKHAGVLAPLVLGLAKFDPSLLKSVGLTEHELRDSFDGNIEIEEIKGEERPGFSIRVSGPKSGEFDRAVSEIAQTKHAVSLLYQNSLVSLVSAVECFLSRIIHTYFEQVPEAMSEADKVFSLNDLKNFHTVEDARAYLIEKKVSNLMRRSFGDWINFFRTKAGLSMSYLDPYMDTLVETCERRNLLVHNAGIINSIYLSKVSSDLRKGKKKGEQLHLTRRYLDERIDYFELYSILIVAELWKKLAPADTERADILSGIAYRHVLQSRWRIAEGLSYFMMNDSKTKEPARLIGKLNYWQSVKRQGRWEEVKGEATTEDFSAKGHRYQLGHLALLGNRKEFFSLVPVALKAKEISVAELREFPIFEDIRRDRRFAQYRASSKKKAPRKRTASATRARSTVNKKKDAKEAKPK